MCLKKNNNKRAGVTLVELMIGTALTGMVGLGIAVYLSQQQRIVKRIESKLRMASIARQVERAIADPKVISFSAGNSTQPGNLALKNCITPNQIAVQAGTSCTATDPQNQQSFDLILPIKTAGPFSAARLDTNTIAGHDLSVGLGPAYYQLIDGVHCSRIGNRPAACNVEVRAFFWATCPPGAGASRGQLAFAPASCPTAQSLHVHYQVAYRPTATSIIQSIPNIPDDKTFYTNGANGKPSTVGAITLSVNVIPSVATAPIQCPANSTETSIVNGKPVCQCMYPFQNVSGCVGNNCACTDVQKKCDTNHRYRGYDLQGNIICCPVYCEEVLVDSSSLAGCRAGGWIEGTIVPTAVPPPPSTIPLPPPPPPDLSCKATSECMIGKWGGTCSVPVTCQEAIKCCYDYVPPGTGGSFGVCNGGF